MSRIVFLFLVEKTWVSPVGIKADRPEISRKEKVGDLPEL